MCARVGLRVFVAVVDPAQRLLLVFQPPQLTVDLRDFRRVSRKRIVLPDAVAQLPALALQSGDLLVDWLERLLVFTLGVFVDLADFGRIGLAVALHHRLRVVVVLSRHLPFGLELLENLGARVIAVFLVDPAHARVLQYLRQPTDAGVLLELDLPDLGDFPAVAVKDHVAVLRDG